MPCRPSQQCRPYLAENALLVQPAVPVYPVPLAKNAQCAVPALPISLAGKCPVGPVCPVSSAGPTCPKKFVGPVCSAGHNGPTSQECLVGSTASPPAQLAENALWAKPGLLARVQNAHASSKGEIYRQREKVAVSLRIES